MKLKKKSTDVKDKKNVKRNKCLHGQLSITEEVNSRDESAERFEKLKEEIAGVVKKNSINILEVSNKNDPKDTGFIDERDFEDLIYDNLDFDAENYEMDKLIEYYGQDAKKGYVDYKLFDQEIYAINKGVYRIDVEEKKHKKHDDDEQEDEGPKISVIPISVRTSPNLPDDARYSLKNTVAGRYPESRKQKRLKARISQAILEDIIKATYLRDKFIEDAFIKFSQGRINVITQDDLRDAFTAYGIKISKKKIPLIHDNLMCDEPELTAQTLDIVIEDTAKRGIEEIQKEILEEVNHYVRQHHLSLQEAFLRYDQESSGFVSFDEYRKCLKIFSGNLRSYDLYFLAKRYCLRDDDTVYYFSMLDEIDLLDRGINPLMTWAEELAEYIVKAVVAYDTNFEKLFIKHSPRNKYLNQKQFIKAMEEISVDSKFNADIIKKFYYFIDDDKNQKVDFKELESIVKTHCNKSNQKLTDEILDTVKSQMLSNKIKIRDLYYTLDGYSYHGLIDRKSFLKTLSRDLRIRLEEIDYSFLAIVYRDRRDKKSVRYSQFLDDLKQKFELTQTYVVPGKKRRQPDHKFDDVLKQTKSNAKFMVSVEEREKEIRSILKTFRAEAHNQRVDLKDEFRKRSERKNGIVLEDEFRRMIDFHGMRIEKSDLNKLVERFIDTQGYTIDTNLILDLMYEDTQTGLRPKDDYKETVETPIIGKIARKLDQGGLCETVIINLKKRDLSDTQYLSSDHIKEAFRESDFKLSSSQVKEMLSEIRRNMQGEYNYHILLSSMFGENYTTEIAIENRYKPKSEIKPRKRVTINTDRDSRSSRKSRSPRHKSRPRSKRSHDKKSKEESKSRTRDSTTKPPRPKKTKGILKRTVGHQARAIGKRLNNSRYDYIDHLRIYAEEDKDYILTDSQVYKLLDKAKIRLSEQERSDFVRDMGDSRFTVEDFLIRCELDLGPYGRDGPIDTRISLNKEEKQQAEKLLADIGLAIEREKKEFERIFNIGPHDDKVEFNEFQYGVENELDEKCARIANDIKTTMLLKNYLLHDSENDDKIKVKLLYMSLFPSGEGKPQLKSRMNVVSDFVEFLKQNRELKVDEEFKGGVSHEQFEKVLDAYEYNGTSDDIEKLKQAFTDPNKPEKVSINLIKRNINLLAPDYFNKDAVITKEEIGDRLSHVDPKIK